MSDKPFTQSEIDATYEARIAKLVEALAASEAREREWRDTLRDAVKAVRLAEKQCPIRSNRSNAKKCPLCGSGPSQRCARFDVAEGALVRLLLGLFPDAPAPETGETR